MKTILDKLLQRFLIRKYFFFRFDEYTGQNAESMTIYKEGVIEYELINSGTTVIVIGEGLKLYPSFSRREPMRVKLNVNYNECDETTYKYKFEPLDYTIVSSQATYGGDPVVTLIPLSIKAIDVPGQPGKDQILNDNKLIVISKVPYRKDDPLLKKLRKDEPLVRK